MCMCICIYFLSSHTSTSQSVGPLFRSHYKCRAAVAGRCGTSQLRGWDAGPVLAEASQPPSGSSMSPAEGRGQAPLVEPGRHRLVRPHAGAGCGSLPQRVEPLASDPCRAGWKCRFQGPRRPSGSAPRVGANFAHICIWGGGGALRSWGLVLGPLGLEAGLLLGLTVNQASHSDPEDAGQPHCPILGLSPFFLACLQEEA